MTNQVEQIEQYDLVTRETFVPSTYAHAEKPPTAMEIIAELRNLGASERKAYVANLSDADTRVAIRAAQQADYKSPLLLAWDSELRDREARIVDLLAGLETSLRAPTLAPMRCSAELEHCDDVCILHPNARPFRLFGGFDEPQTWTATGLWSFVPRDIWDVNAKQARERIELEKDVRDRGAAHGSDPYIIEVLEPCEVANFQELASRFEVPAFSSNEHGRRATEDARNRLLDAAGGLSLLLSGTPAAILWSWAHTSDDTTRFHRAVVDALNALGSGEYNASAAQLWSALPTSSPKAPTPKVEHLVYQFSDAVGTTAK